MTLTQGRSLPKQPLNTAASPPPHPELAVAPVQTVFSSPQGEGPLVGIRQIFVRFAHCHLHCAYCDTPMHTPTGEAHIETVPGAGIHPTDGRGHWQQNPLSVTQVLEAIQTLNQQGHHHSVSLTGGEPLLYHRFLQQLMPAIQQRGLQTYLETSGTQPEFLQSVLPHTDWVAMDVKLPSATLEAPQFEHHHRFYQVLKTRPETTVFLKLIFNDETTLEEMQQVIESVPEPHWPVFLQPETALPEGFIAGKAFAPFMLEGAPSGADDPTAQKSPRIKASPETMWRLQSFLSTFYQEVRVVPQTHKLLQVL